MTDPVDTDTQSLLDDLRARGAERTRGEVASATGGLPKSLVETLSAFANGTGGTVLLGLDDDFDPVDADVKALRGALAQMAAQKLEPPVTGDIEIEVVDAGHRVVRFDVQETDASAKPCHVKERGAHHGSYVRTGEGDRRLTGYEVDRLLENRTQPVHDREPVLEASPADLDPGLVDAYLERLRSTRPRAFDGLDDEQALARVGILVHVEDRAVPTMAGLMSLGAYPQQYFPQLFVSVVVTPGADLGELGPAGERFLDNRTIEGAVPQMASDAVAAVARSMARTSVMDGGHRVDRLEYPLEVVRELVVNALMHRDYSPAARGSQVQVELHPDRLVVRSPGGFFGPVDPRDLGAPAVSSSRNALLAKILSEAPLPGTGHMVAENRGSGIPTIMRALHAAGMAPPDFVVELGRVEVTVPRHALIDQEALRWVASLGQPALTSSQVQALVLLRAGHEVRNQTLQGWGVHRADATGELGDLVRRGLATKVGDRRGSSYRLSADVSALPPTTGPDSRPGDPEGRRAHIVELIRAAGTMTARDLVERLPVDRGAVLGDLNALIERGLVEATAPPRSKRRAYRLADPVLLPPTHLSRRATPARPPAPPPAPRTPRIP